MLQKVINKILRIVLPARSWAKYQGVKIGRGTIVKKCHWDRAEGYLIEIGSHTQLTNCMFFTHGGGRVIRRTHPDFDCFGKIVVGDYVYIGYNSMIMPGVTIGDHVLVAAGSVVTKSIPAGVVVAGNPARYVCTIEEYYERNKRYNTGSKGMSKAQKKQMLKQLPEDKFIHKNMIRIPEK